MLRLSTIVVVMRPAVAIANRGVREAEARMVEQIERVPPELDVRASDDAKRFDSEVSKLMCPGA